MEHLTEALQLRSPRPAHIFHVAGTNGKGSVCAMIAQICREHGFRTGLYTSPHLVTCRERIQVDGEFISEPSFAEGVAQIRATTEGWAHPPTFFEITTALALWHFQREHCEVVILETGMGGRLDATNVITPSVSVLTPIDYDHQKWLGETLTEIAGEKAGIIKPGTPVVSSPQKPEAETVLRAAAAAGHSPIEIITEQWKAGPVGLSGEHQLWNAALAIRAVAAAGLNIPTTTIQKALQNVKWPGRFQEVRPGLFLDGAHNPAAAQTIASAWHSRFDEKPIIVFSMLADKAVAEVCHIMASFAAEFVLTPIHNPRTATAEALRDEIQATAPRIPCTIAHSSREALEIARASGKKILVAGSLYLIGEVLAIVDPSAVPDPVTSY